MSLSIYQYICTNKTTDCQGRGERVCGCVGGGGGVGATLGKKYAKIIEIRDIVIWKIKNK